MTRYALWLTAALAGTIASTAFAQSDTSDDDSYDDCEDEDNTPTESVSSFIVTSSSATPTISASTISDSVISVSGCPPITVTTSISRSFSTIYLSTVTSYYPPYFESSTTSFGDSTTRIYAATVTSYVATSTAYSLVVPSATTTVTVPTSAGFTPLLCEPTYYEATDLQTFTYYPATPSITYLTDFNIPTSTLTSFTLIFSSTITTSVTDTLTKTATATTTITTTRANPTSTVYDACQTNNVSPLLSIKQQSNAFLVSVAANTTYTRTVALDAPDCCSLCQANSTCVASTFETILTAGNNCALFYKTVDQDTCDPRFVGAIGQVGVVDAAYHTMSNSGCGQFLLAK